MATYSVSWTTSKITITVYGVKSGDSIRVYYRKSSVSTATTIDKTATGSSVKFEITGISSNTEYLVNVRDGSGSNIGSKTFTTSGSGTLPKFTVDSITTDSVTVTASGFIPNEYVLFQITKYSNNSKTNYGPYYLNATTLTKTFTGLTAGTVYYVDVQIASAFWIGGSSITDGTKFTTPAVGVRPDNWSWTSTIAKGKPIKITAVEWNNFCTRINAFRIYQNKGNHTFTTVSTGMPISAAIVNEARSGIYGLNNRGTLPTAATKGDKITASFFNTLKDALNAVP